MINSVLLNTRVYLIVDAHFQKKVRDDYAIDVSIWYADRDYQFPCIHLLPFIESLGLKAFVTDRDMPSGISKSSGIMDAVQSSWRLVVVVSDKFLYDDEWAEFITKAAVYSQTPSDPERILVVTSYDVVDRLPVYLMAAVTDDRVLCVDRLDMCYELRQRLRTFLS